MCNLIRNFGNKHLAITIACILATFAILEAFVAMTGAQGAQAQAPARAPSQTQQAPGPDVISSSSQSSIPFNEFVQYQKMMREEATEFREFIKWIVERAFVVLTGLFGIVGIFLGFLNWKTRTSVQDEARSRLATIVDKAVVAEVQRREDLIKKSVSETIETKLAESRKRLEDGYQELEDKVTADIKRLRDYSERWFVALTTGPHGEVGFAQQIKGKRILWVDDHPENNIEIAELFKSWGATVDEPKTTDEGMRLIKTDRRGYDLVISDMNREGNPQAGLDFINTLRKENILIPIIICTGALRERERAIMQGAADLVTTNPDLLKAVAGALRDPGLGQS